MADKEKAGRFQTSLQIDRRHISPLVCLPGEILCTSFASKVIYFMPKSSHIGAVIPLCHASSASIGTVVIAYVYHDASPATLA